MMDDNQKKVKLIGRAELTDFPELRLAGIPARIDTGAKTSSIWATDIRIENKNLSAVLFGEGKDYFTGKPIVFDNYQMTVVSTSTGEIQERYKVPMLIKLKGKKIRAWFTLADRSTQVYPVLIGRNVLLGKFLVDVKKGRILKEDERRRSESLKSRIREEEE